MLKTNGSTEKEKKRSSLAPAMCSVEASLGYMNTCSKNKKEKKSKKGGRRRKINEREKGKKERRERKRERRQREEMNSHLDYPRHFLKIFIPVGKLVLLLCLPHSKSKKLQLSPRVSTDNCLMLCFVLF